MYSRKVDKPLFLYGAGKLGQLAVEVMNELAIMTSCMVDKNGLIKSEDILPEVKKRSLIAVCCTTEPYWKIAESLRSDGWNDIVSVYDIFNAYPECGITNGWKVDYNILNVKNEFHEITVQWDDGWSYNHYLYFTAWRCRSQEFPILKWAPVIPDYAVVGGIKILAGVENYILAAIRERRKISVFNYPLPFVNIHMEGMELPFIQREIPFFQQYRPILKVACYHNEDGLWKIEKFLMDNLVKYKFYFRLHAFQAQAAYMYCVPEEKVKE
jgi:hypothetical protein